MKPVNLILLILAMFAIGIAGGCSKEDQVAATRGVYMLIDTSGTYTDELKKAQAIINFVLAKLNPGDSFAVASINTGSFTEKDIIAKVTFDDRPSMANHQKRQFKEEIEDYETDINESGYYFNWQAIKPVGGGKSIA